MKGLHLFVLCLMVALCCDYVLSEDLAANTPCIIGEDEGLTLSDLRKWLASVTQELNYTYVTPDNGVTLYKSSSIKVADDRFRSAALQSKPKKVWTNNSPCHACVSSLINTLQPFTMYISHVSDMGSSDELKCLAKMMYKKFTIAKMDWAAFANSLTNTPCRDMITTTMNQSSDFKAADSKLANLISTVKILSKSKDVKTFCV